MSAATADRATRIRHPEASIHRVRYPIATATTVYKGTLVMLVAGYLTSAADTAGGMVVGVAQQTVINAGADGAAFCLVDRGNAWHFVGSGIAAADVGKLAYVTDNQTVQDAANTNKVVAGSIEEIDADGGIWVSVPVNVETLSILMVAIAAAGA